MRNNIKSTSLLTHFRLSRLSPEFSSNVICSRKSLNLFQIKNKNKQELEKQLYLKSSPQKKINKNA